MYSRLMRGMMLKKQLIILAIGLVLFFTINPSIWQQPFYFWLVPFVLAGGLLWWMAGGLARRAFNAATNLHQPMHYTFSEQDIKVQTDDYTGSYAWTEFKSAAEMSDCFVLYQPSKVFNPIPKNGFSNAADLDVLRNLLRDKGLLTT